MEGSAGYSVAFLVVGFSGPAVGWLFDRFGPVFNYAVGIIIAGLIFGVGFAVAGYCPGTCVVAAGEGKTDAIATILGGLTGAMLFALVYPMLGGLMGITNYGEVTLPSVFGVNGILIAVPFSAMLFLLIFKVLKDRY